MKRFSAVLLILSAVFCAPWYMEAQTPTADFFRQEGIASWYGPEFDGRPTSSGEIFNSSFFTAAHPTLPFGTMLRITNRHNNKQVTVRVNDRGPFVSARIIDVSKAAAEQLDMLSTGTAPVLVESVERIVIIAPEKTEEPDPYWTAPAAPESSTAAETTLPQVTTPQATTTPQAATPATPQAPPQSTTQASPYPPASEYVPNIPAAPATAPPVFPAYRSAVLTPAITPAADKIYRLQVGSYKIAKNAMDSFERLKSAGLNPAYERNGEFYRVVLAGIRGNDVQSVVEKIGAAGFREALIREER
jgi:rare lipoprotein A